MRSANLRFDVGALNWRTLLGIVLALVVPTWIMLRLEAMPEPQWRIDQAELTLAAETGPGANPGAPQAARVSLPDPWHLRRPTFLGAGTYRLTFVRGDAPAVDQMLFIPRVATLHDLQLNRQPLAIPAPQHGRQDEGFNRAVYVQLDNGLLRQGENELMLTVSHLGGVRTGLSPVYVAPRAALEGTYRARWLIQEQLLIIINLIALGLCVPIFSIWLMDRDASGMYGLFAAGVALFAARNMLVWLDFPGTLETYRRPFADISIGWSVLLLAFFCFRFTDYRNRKLERAMLAYAVLVSLVLLLLGQRVGIAIETYIWRLPLLLVTVFCILLFLWRTFAQPTTARLFLVYGFVAQIAPAIHDLMWRFDAGAFATVRWLPLIFPMLLLMMVMVLAHEFTEARLELLQTNSRLEEKVADVSRELAETYQQKRRADMELAGSEERQRLIRDMHDSVGSQLTLLAAGLRRGQMSTGEATAAIESSLEDLRLLIDARSPSTRTLIDAMANFRYRMNPRLTALGVQLDWAIDDRLEDLALPSKATLHVLRIAQECVSNAIRHGGASRISFELRCWPQAVAGDGKIGEGFSLSIVDNGSGPAGASPSTAGNRQGLANIRARAAAVGGSFTLEAGDGQTIARLTVGQPLQQDAEPDLGDGRPT